ncbi:MAG TPA: GDSL-type esterase/lipase family protein, partial [Elusimicrobiota bacterium]|nr:GDSL-type esterase/lipase family protein [Elusimicrobiota bacterium]
PPSGSGDPEGQYIYWMARERPHWKIINCGVAGQRTDEIRARFESAINTYRPNYIVILAGVNDIYQGYPLEAAARNLAWMYEQAQLKGVIPVAATVLPCDVLSSQQSKEIDALNNWIRKTAGKLRIPVADLHSAVADPKTPWKLSGSPDGRHPDIGGYRRMGKVVLQALDAMEADHPPR